MRIAVVGSGVSGLVCAHLLHSSHEVTIFEEQDRPGGHTNTVDVVVDGQNHRVDTGFIVYNERTYPNFVKLIRHLEVGTRPSDMSFSVSDERTGLEWRGSSWSTLFAQRRNLARPAFHRMLVDVARFSRAARRLLERPDADADKTLDEFVAEGGWSQEFVDWYLVPMGSAIWSADPASFTRIPALTFARFFDNHGLLRLGDQPLWRTIEGGAIAYVEALLRPLAGRVSYGAAVEKIVRRPDQHTVELRTAQGDLMDFDHVVLAAHSDQALEALADPTPAEREVLGAIGYQPNLAILHTDERLLPRAWRARASWNYHRTSAGAGRPMVTYDLCRLQGIRSSRPLLLTLNRDDVIDPATVLATFEYDHPVLDTAAIRAQGRHADISGRDGVSYAGAYWGYGFHEDGVASALRVCQTLGTEVPW